MKFQFMREHEGEFPQVLMGKILGVSRSGFDDWKRRGGGRRDAKDLELVRRIEDIHRSSRRTYGSPRILAQLRAMGYLVGKNRVERLMKKHGIRAKTKRKFKVTTDSKHNMPIADNVLDRDFSPEKPNEAWAGDITYVWTAEGWLFLAVIIDLFSRQVVGWSMNDRMTRKLTLNALTMALERRNPGKGLLHHSDRGSQYCSADYRKVLKLHSIVESMSRKGNCWDNAVVESFFHTLKTEMIYDENFSTREEAKKKIFEWIEVFYNRQRIHSALGYVTPAQFDVDGLRKVA